MRNIVYCKGIFPCDGRESPESGLLWKKRLARPLNDLI